MNENHTPSMVLAHPFTDSGLGKPPFKFVGMWSLPSDSLMEGNPNAAEIQMRSMPKAVIEAGCQCQHCHRPLRHFCLIKNAKNDVHVVGTTCVSKTEDETLIAALKAEQRKQRKGIADAKRENDFQRRMEAHRIEQDVQRNANGGATDSERDAAIRMHEKHLFLQQNNFLRDYAHDMLSLSKYTGDFCHSIGEKMKNGELPDGRALDITKEILAKQFGRKNSKAYTQAYDEIGEKFDSIAV